MSLEPTEKPSLSSTDSPERSKPLRHKSTSSKPSGFSLVEVLVALGIIGLALVMFAYFPNSLRLSRISESEAAQAAYMRSYLDALKSAWQDEAYFDLAHQVGGKAVVEPPEPPLGTSVKVSVESAEGVVYSYPGSAGGEDDSALRTITVSLQDETGQSRSLSTQIVRPLLAGAP